MKPLTLTPNDARSRALLNDDGTITAEVPDALQ